MSSPSKITRPWLGGKSPLIRLKKVVLPAPFGPITARSSPAAMSNDTSSTALSVPKWRETFSMRRNGPADAACGVAACAFGPVDSRAVAVLMRLSCDGRKCRARPLETAAR
jgi:hypothetical protein